MFDRNTMARTLRSDVYGVTDGIEIAREADPEQY